MIAAKEDSLKDTPRLRCREIGDEDKSAVAALLARGFNCERSFWLTALARLSERDAPADVPRYGYMLESGAKPVGVLLLIFAGIEEGGATILRCSVSSWYVEPAYRPFAAMLVTCALKHRQATYVNFTPAPQTVPILKAQGYRELWTGRFLTLPLLCGGIAGARVVDVERADPESIALSAFERQLLLAHAAFGCWSVICRIEGKVHPFVFSLRRWHGVPVSALLIYCGDMDDFVRCAGALGRFLARRGIFCVTLLANRPIAGLQGLFRRTTPTFYLGPAPPRLGNLAYSECAMFGV